jgi:hypothetical protein
MFLAFLNVDLIWTGDARIRVRGINRKWHRWCHGIFFLDEKISKTNTGLGASSFGTGGKMVARVKKEIHKSCCAEQQEM